MPALRDPSRRKDLRCLSQTLSLRYGQEPFLATFHDYADCENGDDLAERFNHLQKSVARIFKHRRDYLDKGRGKTEFRKIHGYVGTYEVTKDNGYGELKETGWHPHAHIMVLHTTSFDYKALQAEWKEITGDSHVLNVTAAKHPNEPELDFLEVFKYAVKFSDLEPMENIQAWDAESQTIAFQWWRISRRCGSR